MLYSYSFIIFVTLNKIIFISMQLTDSQLTTDLGELCSPFRYSYPSGCVNSVILNSNNENIAKNDTNSTENKQRATSDEILNGTFSDTNDTINISLINLTMPLCIYSVEIRWPEMEDAITIKLKVRQSSPTDWFGIGFSTGNLMSDGVDAVIVRLRESGKHRIIGQHWYWYDYPDPGSEIDYTADNRVDYVRYYDGVSVAQFRKKIINHKPFELNLDHEAGKGVWLMFPVFGGMISGGIKQHYYTPITKKYKFFQCGSRPKQFFNGGLKILEGSDSSFPLQISQRRSRNGEVRIAPIQDIIEEQSAIGSVMINIQGEWGPWADWTTCSLSCGKGGNRRRQRTCDNPKPSGNGMNCVGESIQSKDCMQTNLCPNQVLACHHPEDAKSNWTWPAGCSTTISRPNNAPKCAYAVFWKWLNGFDVSQFTIVTPFQPMMWSGIQFFKSDDKSFGSISIRSYFNQSTGDVIFQCDYGQLSESAEISEYNECERNIGITSKSVQLVEYRSRTSFSDTRAEFDSIANGGDIFLGYTPKILKEEDINNRAIEYSLLIQFNIDVFDPLGLRGLDLSNKNGSTWFFPVDGGDVDYDVSSVRLLPPQPDKLHDEKIELVPCQPPNKKRSRIKCYVCQGTLCYMSRPGKREICPPGVTTCQKFIGKIDGMHHRMHMCGTSKITAFQSSEGGCKEGIFQTKEGQELEGTFCECWKNACNYSSRTYLITFKTYWFVFIITHLVLNILYQFESIALRGI